MPFSFFIFCHRGTKAPRFLKNAVRSVPLWHQKKLPVHRHPFFPAVVWTVFVTFLSTTSRLPNLPDFDLFKVDKLAHLFVYGVLVAAILWGFLKKNGAFSIQNGVFAVVFAAFWGAAMELWQSFLPYRSFELDDEIANVFGAFVGWFLATRFLK